MKIRRALIFFVALSFVIIVTSQIVTQTVNAQISSTLSIGSRGMEVTQLQSYLATDSTIYPERLITGYYGKLTAAAVSRLQAKYNLAQVGIVGPRTRSLLATLMPPMTQAAMTASIADRTTTSGQEMKAVCNTSLIKNGYDENRVISKEACDLLNDLYSKGAAAGNVGDIYENRDNLHVNLCEGWMPNPDCPAEYKLFPQVAWKLSGGAGAARSVTPGVVVGQASYSGTSDKHSILYVLYQSEQTVRDLYRQYTHNNLYVYPSLVDDALVGDVNDPKTLENSNSLNRDTLNIANTPYVVGTKQIAKAGSPNYRIHDASGSDLPYVKLAFAGLAAFKPDIKEKLKAGVAQNGDQISFLMTTLQMLIRNAHKSVTSDADYLNSPAHRSAVMLHYFANGLSQPAYDSLELVRAANDLSIGDVPPLVQLKVVNETFIDSEKLFTTPGAIARKVARLTARTITVSAKDSIGIYGSSAQNVYEWRLLDHGSGTATIQPNATDPSTATIQFTAGNSIDRIDVGVFVKKSGQKYFSVPGIVSVYVK